MDAAHGGQQHHCAHTAQASLPAATVIPAACYQPDTCQPNHCERCRHFLNVAPRTTAHPARPLQGSVQRVNPRATPSSAASWARCPLTKLSQPPAVYEAGVLQQHAVGQHPSPPRRQAHAQALTLCFADVCVHELSASYRVAVLSSNPSLL